MSGGGGGAPTLTRKRTLAELVGNAPQMVHRKRSSGGGNAAAARAERASSESRNERSVRDRTLGQVVATTSSGARQSAAAAATSSNSSVVARLGRSLSISETAESDVANGIVRDEISELAQAADERTATSMTRSGAPQHPTPPSDLPAAESRLTPAARIAQAHALLRDPQLPNEQRRALLAQLGQARRSAAPEQAQRPAAAAAAVVPAAAQPPPPHASSERCAVCRESFRIFHEAQNAQRAQAASRANDTKETARARSAVLSNGETISDQYKKIFRFEELMSGMMNDNEIIHSMVMLHRELIEKPAQKLNLRYQPWTHAMLAEHFDVANEHIFDPIREMQRDVRMTRRLAAEVERSCLVPNPDNPAQRIVDAKAVGALEKVLKEKRSSIQALEKSMQKRRDTAGLQGAMMQLVGVIGGLAQRDTMRVNPRIAAGTMERGGDALRTVGKSASQIGGTQADLYALSGFQ